jgi:hypothetical protein
MIKVEGSTLQPSQEGQCGDVKFSIILMTYNRPKLVECAIRSILDQSYGRWTLEVVDNGSEPPVVPRSDWLTDPRIRWRRLEHNLHNCDVGEMALADCRGTHLLVLGDDDALVPGALERVASAIAASAASILIGARVEFDHESGFCDIHPGWWSSWDGRLESFDGLESALMFCNGWGIGPKRRYIGPPAAHSSCTFVSIPLIHRTRERQGVLFVKPFGDIGVVGCCANTASVHFLHAPIAIIGKSANQESHSARRRSRHRLAREQMHLVHTGLRGLSWVNVGCEAHLRVAIANQLGRRMPLWLRSEFYRRHLRHVLSDNPWTIQTVKDVLETIPDVLMSLIRCVSPTHIRARIQRWRERFDGTKARARRRHREVHGETKTMVFSDILQAATFVASIPQQFGTHHGS